jgi:hypothetical protein
MAGKADSEVKAMDATWNALSGLQPDEQRRVLVWLIDKLKLSESVSLGTPGAPPVSQQGNATVGGGLGTGEGLAPKPFMAQKKPKTDAERMTCLAYFLTHNRATPQFKTRELTKLNEDAAGSPFSNPAVAVSNAVKEQYLAPAASGKKQITVRGEALVLALPDREKVNAALEEHRVRRRRRHRNAKRRKPA